MHTNASIRVCTRVLYIHNKEHMHAIYIMPEFPVNREDEFSRIILTEPYMMVG